MKVGDLVSLKMKKTQPPQEAIHGILLDIFSHEFLGEAAEVLWESGHGAMVGLHLLEVISETR